MRLKKRQRWLLLLTLFLWGIMVALYPRLVVAVPLQVTADGTVIAAIGKNVFVAVVGCLTALANGYAHKKSQDENVDVPLTFFIPCVLFIVVAGSFPFLALI